MEEWGVEKDAALEPDNAKKGEMEAGSTQQAKSYALFDPCASRYYPELQESVRHLADAAGIVWENLPYDGKKARCCGYGGHIGIASPSHTSYMTASRAKEEELPYVTYCVNCRESFAGQGKEAVHILDLLFGLNGAGRPAATVTERWHNRLAAKRELLKTYWNETIEEETHMKLEVEKELERKLSAGQILIEDMEQVIEHCEREDRGIIDPETGHRIGHLKIQHMTYWAEYEVLPEGGYKLWNGYSHRMNLEGE